MNGITGLKAEALAAQALLANIADIIGDDADAHVDAIKGETDLFEIVCDLVGRLATIEALCDGLSEHIKKASARKKRLEDQAEMIRTAIGAAMDQAGLRKIEAPLATVSVRKVPPKVLVTEEADLPAAYLKTKVEPDLKVIGKALKDGLAVPGATLSNGSETISISRV